MKFKSVVIMGLMLLIGCAKMPTKQHHMIGATLWVQTSAENKALSYQAFNMARLVLDRDLKQSKHKQKRAIIVDVDETIIDNSPYQAQNIINNESYNSKTWQVWVDKRRAEALPGAVKFLRYADSVGVDVFYVTNRKINKLEATYDNLKQLGFPIKKENLLMRVKSSSKKSRRAKVASNHRIVLLMGDNMNDFSELYEKKSVKDRRLFTDRNKDLFGTYFILLPNPLYGDWEGAVYNYKWRKSDKQKYLDWIDNLRL
ncbi:MAG: 5'-nucleotidase, lipoprotein e(P4) family [Bacteriovoracaceae bacterium]|nr:5'-nucleotidase, lipoprotein e(P4) family [Bacteriovoracaceae bacterium]